MKIIKRNYAIFALLIFLIACSDPYSNPKDTNYNPVFSHNSGFYQNDFYLELSCEDGDQIYYSTDCSIPDQSSTLYTGPILIKSRTGEPNDLSMIPTTAGYTEPSWQGGPWIAPDGEVFKVAIIRARIYNYNSPVSNIITKTYFVSEDIEDRYSLPIISLTTERDNFFGYNTGIHVPGESFDNNEPAECVWGYGNYYQSGSMWERPAHMEYFDLTGNCAIDLDIGVRIHGQVRAQPIHGMNLYTRSEYGSSWINYDFFNNDITQYKRIKLRAGGSLWYASYFNDALSQSLLRNTGLDIQDWQPVIVFINGEYWGIYNIRDFYNRFYLQTKYGFTDEQRDNLDFFSNTEYEEGDNVHYNEMLNYMSDQISIHGEITDEAYNEINQYMDINNFIDWQVSILCLGGQLFPNDHNEKRWRLRTDYDPELQYGHDGRWRWMVIDCDAGFANPGYAPIEGLFNNAYGVMQYLKTNENFRISFINRTADFINSTFKEDRLRQLIYDAYNLLLPEMPEHIARWNFPESIEFWNNKFLTRSLGFADNRTTEIQTAVIDFFNSNGGPYITGISEIELDLSHINRGKIMINRLLIDQSTDRVNSVPYPWKGYYFKNIPVQITAIPNPGYKFAGWEGIESNEETITITMHSKVCLTAVFEKE